MREDVSNKSAIFKLTPTARSAGERVLEIVPRMRRILAGRGSLTQVPRRARRRAPSSPAVDDGQRMPYT